MAVGILINSQGKRIIRKDGSRAIGEPGAKCCCNPKYRQARKCPSPDGELVDVWMTEADAATLPDAFTLNTRCLYFDFEDATSDTPGTVYPASDATAIDGCEECPSPCDVCGAEIEQPSITADAGELPEECAYSGVLNFFGFSVDGDECSWTWFIIVGDYQYVFTVVYDESDGEWSCFWETMVWDGSGYILLVGYAPDVPHGGSFEIECIDGILTGTAVLVTLDACGGSITVAIG